MIGVFRIVFVLIISSIVAWFIGFLIFNEQIQKFDNSNTERTDAIVVLTGGKNRIDVAKKLFNDGFAEKLFISGVSKEVSLDDIIKPDDVLIVYKNNIEIGQEATNTVENAIEVDNWVDKNNISSIRLVTSNYHMPRSIEEIKSINGKIRIIIHPVFSENISKKWWTTKSTFKFIASEYNKFLFSYIKNWINNKAESEQQ